MTWKLDIIMTQITQKWDTSHTNNWTQVKMICKSAKVGHKLFNGHKKCKIMTQIVQKMRHKLLMNWAQFNQIGHKLFKKWDTK